MTNNNQYGQQNKGSYNKSNSQNAGQYGTEFSTETNAQEVKKWNQQAEAGKKKASGKFSNPQQ